MKFKPMLASKADLEKIKWPMWVTPKLDGIRCCVSEGKVLARSLKLIPNRFIRNELKGLDNLDGELIGVNDFNDSQSSIMSEDGEPDFTYNVFDFYPIDNKIGYLKRIEYLKSMNISNPRVRLVLPEIATSKEHFLSIHSDYVELGFEGTMLRVSDGLYKCGRSTVNQGYLLKHKDFEDSECVILGVFEAQVNLGESFENELGLKTKHNFKEDRVDSGLAGGFRVSWQGKEFSIGFAKGSADHNMRKHILNNPSDYEGKLANFNYQGVSAYGVPRFPRFTHLRSELDL